MASMICTNQLHHHRRGLCGCRLTCRFVATDNIHDHATDFRQPTDVRRVLTEGRTGWHPGRARTPSEGPGGPVLPLPGVSGRATALCWSVPAPPQQQDSGSCTR